MKIDFTILINLKRRPDRLGESLKELELNGIKVFVWTAVDKENGEEGLRLTMMKFFETMINQKSINNVLVLEDDVKFLNYKYFSSCIDQLPEDFDLFYLGLNLLAPAERFSDNLYKVSAAYSSHAIVYSRKAFTAIVKHLPGDKGYDQILNKNIISKGKSFCSYPMIATQRDSVSDIAKFDEYAAKDYLHPYLNFETKTINWEKMMQERYDKFIKPEQQTPPPRPCKEAHKVDGNIPNENDIQFDGRTCECGKLLFYAQLCDSCGGKKMKLKSKPNEEYIPQNV